MKSSIDSSIGFILYVTPAFSSLVVCPLQVLKRGIAFPIHRPSVSKVQLHPLHRVPKSLSSHPSVNPRHYRSLTSPQKRESLSDPCFILGPTASSSSVSSKFPQVILESSLGQSSLSLSLRCRQVLKRGIVSAYPIHAFILDPSAKHFVRIILVRRPQSIIDAKIFVLGIQLPYSSPPHRFFFKPSSLNLFLNSRYLTIQTHGNNGFFFLPILALLWNPGKNWLRATSGRRSSKGG
jgi:hypothetical protein